jgi:beta-phosphoglucomutase
MLFRAHHRVPSTRSHIAYWHPWFYVSVVPKNAVIFDVDGVLVDSPHERAWRESLDELMRGAWSDVQPMTTYTMDRFDTKVYQTLVSGRPRNAGALSILEYFHLPDAATRALVYAEHKQNKLLALIKARQFRVFPDATPFVFDCLRLGFPIAAASSSKNADHLLSSIFVDSSPDSSKQTLLDLFTVNVSGRDVAHGKPYPDIFIAAAQELGVPADHCIVIEDAVSGIVAAKAGGMHALGVARLDDDVELRHAHADLVVHSLDDVSRGALARGRLEAR